MSTEEGEVPTNGRRHEIALPGNILGRLEVLGYYWPEITPVPRSSFLVRHFRGQSLVINANFLGSDSVRFFGLLK